MMDIYHQISNNIYWEPSLKLRSDLIILNYYIRIKMNNKDSNYFGIL